MEELQTPFKPQFWTRQAREAKEPHPAMLELPVPSEKPEELFAEDPLPDVATTFDPMPQESLAMMSLMSQRSKQDPRSSFYAFTLPPGLPRGESAAPNRILHENSQLGLQQFMHAEQQTKGRQLSKEVKKRRNESFPSTDEQSGASWISRFWGKFQTFTERV